MINDKANWSVGRWTACIPINLGIILRLKDNSEVNTKQFCIIGLLFLFWLVTVATQLSRIPSQEWKGNPQEICCCLLPFCLQAISLLQSARSPCVHHQPGGDNGQRSPKHQSDVWHLSKWVVKKLTNKANQRGCEELSPWIQTIANHLWRSAATCNGNVYDLREKWKSVLNHIIDKHVR